MNPQLLARARELCARESGLAVVVTGRADGSFQATVVNAVVLRHPVTGEPVVGFVALGRAKKLANLRIHPQITVTFRSGWDWVTVEGMADLAGPDDPLEGMPPDDIPQLLNEVYAAATGGTADSWAKLDAVFAEERHTAVLVRPEHVYSNLDE